MEEGTENLNQQLEKQNQQAETTKWHAKEIEQPAFVDKTKLELFSKGQILQETNAFQTDNDLESEREKAFSNQFITKLKEICVTLDVAKQKKNVDEQNVNESKDSKDKVQLAMQMESLFMILILKFIAQNSYYHYCLLQSGSYLMEFP